ncbi:Na+/H+ antiporter subunit D [Halobacteriales archaeon SW_7_68_16]|nr:MAG: Na+/H+ antiporter subunit D [Halobacteriales archaeon SW_7_68_16]
MSDLIVAPIVIPLVTAVLALLVGNHDRLRTVVTLGGALGYVLAVAALYDRVVTAGPIVYRVSEWAAPFGISLIADPLSAFMLALAAAVFPAGIAFGVLSIDREGQRLSFHSLVHLMLAGVSGSFLTGDLFNLFVWFEVMLMASYVLVVFYSGPADTRAGLRYVVLNLIGSALMLVAIGGVYATTGTLNLADVSRRLDPGVAPTVAPEPVLGLSALLFGVFALKAGLFPFQFWVPSAYRASPPAVTALLAGVVKKVGIYAMIRLYFTVFAAAPLSLSLPGLSGSVLGFFGPVLFVLGTASVLVGGIAAVGAEGLDELLAHSSISQIGFVALPLAVAATATGTVGGTPIRVLGIAAALVYSLHHGLAKAALFLASGTVRDATGTDRFDRLGGLVETAPVLSAAVFVAALGLVGIPPLSGFFGKLLVFETALKAAVVGASGAELVLWVAIGGAILTTAYLTAAWGRGFWGTPGEATRAVDGRRTAIVATLALGMIAVGIGFEPVWQAAVDAAETAVDRTAYVEAVDPEVVE